MARHTAREAFTIISDRWTQEHLETPIIEAPILMKEVPPELRLEAVRRGLPLDQPVPVQINWVPYPMFQQCLADLRTLLEILKAWGLIGPEPEAEAEEPRNDTEKNE